MKKAGKVVVTIGGPHGATCSDLLAAIGDYVDGSIRADLCREIERHLAQCNPCRVVVDTLRKTLTLYRRQKPYPLPRGFRQRLHAALRRHWVAESNPPPRGSVRSRRKRRQTGMPPR